MGIPFRILVHHVSEERICKEGAERGSINSGACDPRCPILWYALRAWREAWGNLSASSGVFDRSVDFSCSFNLGCRQATWTVGFLTFDNRGIEPAQARILE